MFIGKSRKENRKAIKNRSLREKMAYYWEYYGVKGICILLSLVILVVFVFDLAKQKEYAFTGIFFGAEAQPCASQYLEDYAKAASIDMSIYDIAVQCYPSVQVDAKITDEIYDDLETFVAMVAAGMVDCFAGNIDIFINYAYLGYFVDLRTVLSSAELVALSSYLYYIDEILQQEQDEEKSVTGYPDPTRPELMDAPVPVAISLKAATATFLETYDFREGAVIGICTCSLYPENALEFLRYSIANI